MKAQDFPATRWSLVARCGDDGGAATALVERYADAVHRYLGGKLPDLDPALLDDLVQEVLLALLQRPEILARARAGGDSRFRYLLMRVAWNAARNALRRLRNRQPRIVDPADLDAALSGVRDEDPVEDRDMDRAWALSLIDRGWRELRAWTEEGLLPTECLPVLDRHLVQGQGLRQIAAELDLALATCQRRLSAGREALARSLATALSEAGELGEGADPLHVLGQALAGA